MLRDGTGSTQLWSLGNGGLASQAVIGNINPSYVIQDIADFNGDGRSDLLFRGPGGDVVLWTMDGSTNLSQALVGVIDPNYVIQASADSHRDNNPDNYQDSN